MHILRCLFVSFCLIIGAFMASSCEESTRPRGGCPGDPMAADGGCGNAGDHSGSGAISEGAGNHPNGYGLSGSGAGGEATAGRGLAGGGSGVSGSLPTRCSDDAECGNDGYCNNGICACRSTEKAYCNGQCVDTLWRDEHCGTCNNACPPSEPSCDNGTCVCHSPPCTTGVGGTSGTGGGTGGSEVPPVITIQKGCDGYATRFWDCCKPHCGWPKNVPDDINPMTTCNRSNGSNGGDYDAKSGCDGGDAYTCYGLAPWAVTDNLAYGYTATSKGDICGRCYKIQFTGASHNAPNDPGSAAIRGKTMIVQAINVGSDVSGGQFDILIPGGGVGQFNACSKQWDASESELDEQYGGFLATCKISGARSPEAIKDCVSQKCTSVFGSRGLSELRAGCQWFVDWLQAADNPALVYKEVECPDEIVNKSGMDRRRLNDVSRDCED